jgi:hypothetical protein
MNEVTADSDETRRLLERAQAGDRRAFEELLGSVSMAGSMTAASRVLREAIIYDAHPQRSFRTRLKYTAVPSGG